MGLTLKGRRPRARTRRREEVDLCIVVPAEKLATAVAAATAAAAFIVTALSRRRALKKTLRIICHSHDLSFVSATTNGSVYACALPR